MKKTEDVFFTKKVFPSAAYSGSLTPQLEGARHTSPHPDRTSPSPPKSQNKKGSVKP